MFTNPNDNNPDKDPLNALVGRLYGITNTGSFEAAATVLVGLIECCAMEANMKRDSAQQWPRAKAAIPNEWPTEVKRALIIYGDLDARHQQEKQAAMASMSQELRNLAENTWNTRDLMTLLKVVSEASRDMDNAITATIANVAGVQCNCPACSAEREWQERQNKKPDAGTTKINDDKPASMDDVASALKNIFNGRKDLN